MVNNVFYNIPASESPEDAAAVERAYAFSLDWLAYPVYGPVYRRFCPRGRQLDAGIGRGTGPR